MLCYAMLCYAMLCYAMLCYAMLCYAMLCYAMLCYAIDQRPPFVITENWLGGRDWGLLASFDTPSILREVRVVLVAACSSTLVLDACCQF
jgi:hypothetical protein